MVRFLINKLFHNNVKDIMTGYRAFSYDFVKGFPVLSKGFEIETEMTIHAVDKNYHLVEVPVNYKDRPEGSVSKLNTYKDGFKVLKTIAVLFKEYKPRAFFGILGTLLLIISLILGIPVLGNIPVHQIRFVIASVLFLLTLMMYLSGIVLGVVAKNNKKQYELLMNLMKK